MTGCEREICRSEAFVVNVFAGVSANNVNTVAKILAEHFRLKELNKHSLFNLG